MPQHKVDELDDHRGHIVGEMTTSGVARLLKNAIKFFIAGLKVLKIDLKFQR